MSARHHLSDDQRKELEPILDQLEQTFYKLANKSREVGVDLDGRCMKCDCETFLKDDHRREICARSTCRHSVAMHVIWGDTV